MKCIASICLLMLLWLGCTAQSPAQFAQSYTLKLNRTYADNQSDTTAAIQFGSFSRVAALFKARDSVNVTIYAESQVKGSSTWTLKDSTAIVVASNSGTNVEWILRDNTTEKLPGVTNSVRFRPKFHTGCGTGTPTYDLNVYVSK